MSFRRVSFVLALASSALHAQAGLPNDVANFVERRDLCDHFRGEDPYDAERRAFLESRMNEFCVGTDAELKSLKAKYRANPTVLSRLNAYEASIEPEEKQGGLPPDQSFNAT